MARALRPNRRDRILDAAERAFAQFGFDGASLRRIVTEAKVNLATVYYYFGSKDGLMESVLKRRFGPLREAQLELLREVERRAKGQPLPVEEILRALLLPPLRLAAAAPAKRCPVARLIGRIVTEPNPQTQEIVRRQHGEVRGAFLEALHKSLPKAPLARLRWRLEFVIGALAFILCNPHRLESELDGVCNPLDTKKVLAEMIGLFAPGFRAPALREGRRSKAESRNKAEVRNPRSR
jgi:AcrR family transcriptional regulator